MPQGVVAGAEAVQPEAAEAYVALVRQRQEAELALKRARQVEVEAKRQWHERARKAADFKSKFHVLSMPVGSVNQQIAFRSLGQLRIESEREDEVMFRFRVQRPYALGLRGLESFEYVWLFEAHALKREPEERASSPAPHNIRLGLYKLISLERLSGAECELRLEAVGSRKRDAFMSQPVQVVDIKPYIPRYDSIRVLGDA
ncbi:hypothetical protein CCYA_CCYA08G2320 [Cyanidiococcus yangmingshanensis]|nr:hypothetical protein CCYA_CCYA08G2320 [Cyanidiococcus yangmingshanensis]